MLVGNRDVDWGEMVAEGIGERLDADGILVEGERVEMRGSMGMDRLKEVGDVGSVIGNGEGGM